MNPLVITEAGDLHCLDAKINVDGNALYRQPAIKAMHDPSQEDSREAHAAQWDLNYVALDGSIGCMVNGAGLAMGTMDIIKHAGGQPANFLDVGGGATPERITAAFKIIVSDPDVKAILINVFGGILQCDKLADGIVTAARTLDLKVPLVVRMLGTNVEEGRKILRESGLAIDFAEEMAEAAEKVVAAAGGAK